MKIRRHMCMNIDGCLRNHEGKKIRIFEDNNGKIISDKAAREYLAECKAKGWRVIPMGDEPCDGFNYFGKGCPGHPIEETVN